MNHLQLQLKTSLSKFAVVASVLGLAACGGSNQSQASAPSPAQTYPSTQDQYGSAMGQPQTSSSAGQSMSSGAGQPQNSVSEGTQSPGTPVGATAPSTTGTGGSGNDYGRPYGASGTTSGTGGTGSLSGESQPGGTGTGTMGGAGTMGATSAVGSTSDVSSLSDAQFAGVLRTINQGEIQQAQVAQTKGSSPEVKRFARDMLTAHRSMQAKESALFSRLQITPADSPLSTQLQSDAQNQLSTLQSMKGKDFDQAYMDAQVRAHNDALELVDRILPNAKSSEIKSELQSARSKIEAHLREAERIQQSLQQGKTNTQPQNPQPDKSQPHPSPNY